MRHTEQQVQDALTRFNLTGKALVALTARLRADDPAAWFVASAQNRNAEAKARSVFAGAVRRAG